MALETVDSLESRQKRICDFLPFYITGRKYMCLGRDFSCQEKVVWGKPEMKDFQKTDSEKCY